MRKVISETENKVFRQELSDTELAVTAGGFCGMSGGCDSPAAYEYSHCAIQSLRDIYEGAFTNCAAAVEDGSWCDENDACYDCAVEYQNMQERAKAWR